MSEEWVLPNQPQFVPWVNERFNSSIYGKERAGHITLQPHQKKLREFLSAHSPYRGLLYYHGLGTGKTCASIATVEALRQPKKRAIVLLPKSLQVNYRSEVLKCGPSLQPPQRWALATVDENISKYIDADVNRLAIKPDNTAWIPQPDASYPGTLLQSDVPYDEIPEEDRKGLRNLIDQIHQRGEISQRYTFINYNGLNVNKVQMFSLLGKPENKPTWWCVDAREDKQRSLISTELLLPQSFTKELQCAWVPMKPSQNIALLRDAVPWSQMTADERDLAGLTMLCWNARHVVGNYYNFDPAFFRAAEFNSNWWKINLAAIKESNDKDVLGQLYNHFHVGDDFVKEHAHIWMPMKPMTKMQKYVVDTKTSWEELDEATRAECRGTVDYWFKTLLGVPRLQAFSKFHHQLFDESIVVIDEAHNFISYVVNKSKIGPMLYNLLMQARNIRIILLSGTPIINHPFEAGVMINLLRGPMKMHMLPISSAVLPSILMKTLKDEGLLKYIDTMRMSSKGSHLEVAFLPYGYYRTSATTIAKAVEERDKTPTDLLDKVRMALNLPDLFVATSETPTGDRRKALTSVNLSGFVENIDVYKYDNGARIVHLQAPANMHNILAQAMHLVHANHQVINAGDEIYLYPKGTVPTDVPWHLRYNYDANTVAVVYRGTRAPRAKSMRKIIAADTVYVYETTPGTPDTDALKSRAAQVNLMDFVKHFDGHSNGAREMYITLTDSSARAAVEYALKAKYRPIALKTTYAYPMERDQFSEYFIDETDYKNPLAKNNDTFMRRALGTVSYLGDRGEDMAQLLDARGNPYTGDIKSYVVEVEMSDQQFNVYRDVRKKEFELESKAARSKRGRGSSSALDNRSSTTYRAFSRMACNFVFPENIKRVYPYTMRAELMKEISHGEGDEATEVSKDTKSAYHDSIAKIMDEVSDTMNFYFKEGIELSDKIKNLKEKIETTPMTYDDLEELLKQNNLNIEEIDELMGQKAKYLYKDNIDIKLNNKKEKVGYGLSPKFVKILNFLEDESRKRALVYSQFRTVEGIGLFTRFLEANGYAQIVIIRDAKKGGYRFSEDSLEDLADTAYDYRRFFVFSENEEITRIQMNIYNGAFERLPETMRKQLEEAKFKLETPEDRRQILVEGRLARIIMITQSGAEGISLRNVRAVHIMEPFWNIVRIRQVIGRARRHGSHNDIEDPAERNIIVRCYVSKLGPNHDDFTIKNNDDSKTSDEHILSIAATKAHVVDEFLGMMKSASIDCVQNASHSDTRVPCFQFPLGFAESPEQHPSYLQDIRDDIQYFEKLHHRYTEPSPLQQAKIVKPSVPMYSIAGPARRLVVAGGKLIEPNVPEALCYGSADVVISEPANFVRGNVNITHPSSVLIIKPLSKPRPDHISFKLTDGKSDVVKVPANSELPDGEYTEELQTFTNALTLFEHLIIIPSDHRWKFEIVDNTIVGPVQRGLRFVYNAASQAYKVIEPQALAELGLSIPAAAVPPTTVRFFKGAARECTIVGIAFVKTGGDGDAAAYVSTRYPEYLRFPAEAAEGLELTEMTDIKFVKATIKEKTQLYDYDAYNQAGVLLPSIFFKTP